MSDVMIAARAKEVLEKYGSDKYPPILDETMQLAVRRLLQEEGMELGFGILPLSESDVASTTETLLSHDLESKRTLDLNPGAILGPYLLADEYFHQGIGVWVPVRPEQPIAKEG